MLIVPMLVGAFQPPNQHRASPVTIKCVSQQILLSGFGCRKAPTSMGKTSTAEVFDFAHKRCVTRSIGEALRSG